MRGPFGMVRVGLPAIPMAPRAPRCDCPDVSPLQGSVFVGTSKSQGFALGYRLAPRWG